MQQNEKFGCGKFSIVGPVRGRLGKLGHGRLMCRTYRCANCGSKKLRRARARIAEIASQRKLLRFVTLTLDPKRIPPNTASDRYLRETWREMRVLLARRFHQSIDFIAVLEFQKSGIAHLHVLVGVFIPQQWLSESWQAVGGGRIVDIRYVDVHRIAGYLTAYLAGEKVRHTLALLPSRARIFSCSRSITFWDKKEKANWWLRKRTLDFLREHARQVEKERWEPMVELRPFDLELLMYFEARPSPEAVGQRDPIEVIRAMIRNQ